MLIAIKELLLQVLKEGFLKIEDIEVLSYTYGNGAAERTGWRRREERVCWALRHKRPSGAGPAAASTGTGRRRHKAGSWVWGCILIERSILLIALIFSRK